MRFNRLLGEIHRTVFWTNIHTIKYLDKHHEREIQQVAVAHKEERTEEDDHWLCVTSTISFGVQAIQSRWNPGNTEQMESRHNRTDGVQTIQDRWSPSNTEQMESGQYRGDGVQVIQDKWSPDNTELGIRGNREPGVPPVQNPSVSGVVGSSG